MLDRLRAASLLDRTLVVVTADHGESLGEHGETTHSMFVYEGAIRVPLVVWRPGLVPAGRVVSDPVRLVDVAPTVLELLGERPLTAPHARSLLPLIEGRSAGPPPPAYAETLLPKFYMNWAPLRALRDGRFKLIDAPRPELYDLQTDPGESRNLYAERAQTASALRQGLERLAAAGDAMSLQTLDREAMEKLAALGYIGAGAEPQTAAPESLADPKDFIALFDRLRQANSAVRERRFDEAIPILKTVLADDPEQRLRDAGPRQRLHGPGIEPGSDRAVPPLPRARPHELVRAPVDGDLPRAARRARAGAAGSRGRARARPEVHGRAGAEGRGPRRARRARRRRHRAARGDRHRPREADDPARSRKDPRRGRPPRRSPCRVRGDPEARARPRSPRSPASAPLLAGQGDLAGAEATLRRALAGEPAAAQARLNLAQVLEQGRPTRPRPPPSTAWWPTTSRRRRTREAPRAPG